MEKHIVPIGVFSVILVVLVILGNVLLKISFVNTSDEEKNKLILNKKATYSLNTSPGIREELYSIFVRKKEELYNKLVLRLGRADSTDYRAVIQVLGSLSEYASNLCNNFGDGAGLSKNNKANIRALKELGGYDEQKAIQECRKRFNNDINQFILNELVEAKNDIEFSLDDIAWKMEKVNDDIWAAVFDYDLGTHKYHQCADAAIYLNAMYKYEKGYKDQLIYSFANRDKTSYKEWLNGIYYMLDSDNVSILHKKWKSAREDSLETFYGWLKVVWEWAGTPSLPYDTEEVDIMDMKPGDIFNQGGHAISVVDIIINKETGNKKYMLSQSYMIDASMGDEQHILLNRETGGVWYDLSNDYVDTPEWLMDPQIIRFK